MKKARQLKLAEQYRKTILYMLDRSPGNEYWNSQLIQINDLIRKLK